MCPVCTMKLTPEVYTLLSKACGPCGRQIKQMMSGFRGVTSEPQKVKLTWDNTAAFEEWKAQLTSSDLDSVPIRKKDEYTQLACDVRDMKLTVGLPTWLPLEEQVYTGWICETAKDERLQELLGLTYSQLLAVKTVVKNRLQKHMNYYRHIKDLAEGNNGRV
jgi:hypothetical protein